MAKRQNFIVGSTNGNTETQTVEALNRAWDQYAVLHSGTLDGVFNAVSDYSNDSSNEIANAIQSITGAEPTGANQSELASALSSMRVDIESTAITFKGFVATSAPSASTYSLKVGNLWINSSSLPTSFPVAASSIKKWDGSSWVNYGATYTPVNFDFFRNINNKCDYFWFGGAWCLLTTDFSTDYFTLNASTGKWQISTSYNNSLVHRSGTEDISGTKTFNNQTTFAGGQGIKFATSVTDYFTMRSTGSTPSGLAVLLNNSTAYMSFATGAISLGNSNATLALTGSSVTAPNVSSANDNSTKVATTAWVHSITDNLAPKASPALTGNPTAPTQSASNNSTRIATTAFVHSITDSLAPKASPTFTGTPKSVTPSSVADNTTQIATTAHIINILKAMYPVGSLYIGTQNTCPMGTFFGTWTLVSSGKALWTGTGSNGNTTIAAGLPNITGSVTNITSKGQPVSTGALSSTGFYNNNLQNTGGTDDGNSQINIDASQGGTDAIYGKSTTVQPPAYVVNVWRRTA